MKRFATFLCLILVLSVCVVLPASAEEAAPYASKFFMSRDAYLHRTSDTSFQAWFEVTAMRGMAELGADYIEIERSSDGVNWSVVKTYDRDDYSNMIKYNTSNHCSYVTYSEAESGYQYRMYVNLYAKDSSGNIGTSGMYGYF